MTTAQVNQSPYPKLPEVPDNKFICFADTAFQNMQIEWVGGIIITHCARKGEWQKVSLQEFIDLMITHPYITEPFYESTLQTVTRLKDKKLIIFFEESEELLITPDMAKAFL